MNINSRIVIFSFIFFLTNSYTTQAQPSSFQISMDIIGHRLGDVMVNEEDKIMALFYGPPFTIQSPQIYLMDLTEGVSSEYAVKLFYPDQSKAWGPSRSVYFHDRITILQSVTQGPSTPLTLINYNVVSGESWARKPVHWSPLSYGDFIHKDDGNIIYLQTIDPYILELYHLDSLGNDIWHIGLLFSKPGFNTFQLLSDEIAYIPNEGYYISGRFDNYNNTGKDECFILKTDLDGMPVTMKTLPELDEGQIYAVNDGIYLLGKTNVAYPFTDNKTNAVLARFTPDLELEWAKVFHADAFEYANATMNILPDGNLVLGYSTYGAFPVVLARLDAAGNIQWQRGYPLYEPQIDALSDGSLLLTTRLHFDSTGAVFPRMIVSKTDPLGFIEGCPVLPSCLKSNPVSLTFGTMNVDTFHNDSLALANIATGTAQFSFSDFCEIPAPPTAYFDFPDTLCLGDSAWTTGVYNQLAHKVEWQLTGNNTDITLEDSLTFGHRFIQPGEYHLLQRVWFLGCAYDYEQTIVVLDDLKINIDPSGTVCDLLPVSLSVASGRPLKSYLWSNAVNSPSIEVSQSGQYAVTVSDGYCTAADSAGIVLVASQFGGRPPLILPSDTALCPQDLPWEPSLFSDFTDVFLINGEPTILPLKLYDQGVYSMAVNIDGCDYGDVVSLQVDDCTTAVYLPNVFSPNGDGINDGFFPQGKNFEPIKLAIYDRWGGLVKEIKLAPFMWNAHDIPQGVYVYIFEYLETISRKRHRIEGTVTVLR